MNRILLIGLIVGACSLVACNECVTCTNCDPGVTFNDGDDQVCRNEYDNDGDYNATIELLEGDLFGCTCN